MTCACHRAINLGSFQAIGRDSSVFASTISGEYVSDGRTEMHTMLRSQITIEEATGESA
jgi:hypothetical protein